MGAVVLRTTTHCQNSFIMRELSFVLQLVLCLSVIQCCNGEIVTHEYSRQLKDEAKIPDTLVPPKWTSFTILTETAKADMECAVRCSQNQACLSFISSSNGTCYTGQLYQVSMSLLQMML